MSTKMLLTAKLDQRLVMSQQLTQAITLLQYNTLDLKQLVKQYIETNPLIEIENPENLEAENTSIKSEDSEESGQLFNFTADLSKSNRYNGDETTLENYSIPKTLREHLMEQTLLCQFNPLRQTIAETIIDSVDENGQLPLTLTEILKMINDEKADLVMTEEVLKKIQTFDPPGVAARDLRECLLIQLDHLSTQDQTWTIAKKILSGCFELLSKYDHKAVIKSLSISQQEFTQAMTLVKTLNPKPGLSFLRETDLNNEPELYVKKVKNKWKVFLSESILTNIKINNEYQNLIRQNKKHESYDALSKELQEAQWLLKGLQRRNETLMNVASHIVKLQTDFLDYGRAFMKPMNIIDVSQALSIHESTVSRVTTGKYLATPRGVFELKYFFPSYVLTSSGEACSDTAVKEMIKELIETESGDKPHSDNDIAKLLKDKGVNIARRTIAKYREALKILPSYQRCRVD